MKRLLTILFFISLLSTGFAQTPQTVSIGTQDVNPNAVLWLNGNGSQGLIIPIMSVLGQFTQNERGMMAFNNGKVHFWDGGAWVTLGAGDGTGGGGSSYALQFQGNDLNLLKDGSIQNTFKLSATTPTSGSLFAWNGTAWSAVQFSGDISNDASGLVTVNGLKGKALPTLPNSSQALIYNGFNWAFQTLTSGTDSQDLTLSGSTLSLTNDATPVTLGALAIRDAVGSAQITDGEIANADISTTAAIDPSKIGQASATSGQVLKWNGTAWAPQNDAGTTYSAGTGITINGSNQIGISNGGVTSTEIADGTISGGDLATNINLSTSGNITTTGTGTLTVAGTSTLSTLSGTGTRMVVASPTGVLSTQTLPTASNLDGLTDVTVASPADAQILIKNGAGDFTNRTVSGDVAISNTGVTSIQPGVIVNADINASAAISGSKISPDFGSQNILTTGNITAGGNLNIHGLSYNWPLSQAGGVLTNDGTGALVWSPSVGLSSNLPAAQIFVGNVINQATAVDMTGDATLTDAGVITIANGAISGGTGGKLADGSVTNDDVSASAAIEGTKIDPNFGNQVIVSTGGTSGSDTYGTNVDISTAGTIYGHFSNVNSSGGASTIASAFYGKASGGTLANHAVYGEATGAPTNYGLWGSASGSGLNYGVYGLASGPGTNWAGYFQGNTAITDGLALGASNDFGTSGQVLTSQGAGLAPIWSNASGFSTLNFIPKGDGSGMISSSLYDIPTYTGIGRTSAITSNSRFDVDVTTFAGDYGGMYINTSDGTGWPFYGYATAGSARAWSYVNGATGTWHLNNGADLVTVTNTGRIGLGIGSAGLQPVYQFVNTAVSAATAKLVTIAPVTAYVDNQPGILEIAGASADLNDEIGVINFTNISNNTNNYNFARISAHVDDGANDTYASLRFYTRAGATMSERMRINSLGLVGVGRNAVSNIFEVEGNASKTAAGSWLANSDRRIKTDIRDVEGIDLVKKLRPVKFKYTEEWKKQHPSIKDIYYYNFIAQEFREVFPEAVQGSGEFLEGDPDEILQIDTYNANIVTLRAVQELIQKVEVLEKENEALKATNARLEQELRNEIAEIKRMLGTEAKAVSKK